MSQYYYPKVKAILTIPLLGSTPEEDRLAHGSNTLDIEVRVRRCELEKNDHLLADTCSISVEYQDLNIDPRLLRQARLRLWMGTGQPNVTYEPGPDELRFIGICISATRKTVEGGLAIEMVFHDFTALFLAQKPVAPLARPAFKATLREAWAQICSYVGYWDVDTGKMVSNVEALKDRIEAFGTVDLDAPIGKSVSERIAKFGHVGSTPQDDAWTLWQRVVMGLGYISYIEKDRCIVTTAGELFKESEAPVLMYGHNIVECEEQVDTHLNAKGVMLYSYDHTTGRLLEAFYPPPGDVRIKVKRQVARKKGYKTDDIQSDQYEPYEYHDIKDQAVLQELAYRAYSERSRQEIQGSVKTAEFFLYGADGDFKAQDPDKARQYDVLDLGANQCIEIRLDHEYRDLFSNEDSETARVQRLIDMGYDADVATFLARVAETNPYLKPTFHTRRVHAVIEEMGDGTKFDLTIHYWNKIRLGPEPKDTP